MPVRAPDAPCDMMPRRVLLVDDDDGVRCVVRRYLESAGLAVISAADGPSGLRALAETHIDVVISDARMPGMSGEAFVAAVDQQYPYRQEKIVLMSGDMCCDSVQRVLEDTGCADWQNLSP